MKIDKSILIGYINTVLGYMEVSTITIISRYDINDNILINYSFLFNNIFYYRSILQSEYLKFYRKYKLNGLLNII